MIRILPLLCLTVLLFAGCNPFGLGTMLVDEAKEKVALGYIEALMEGRSERIIADLDPSVRDRDPAATFAKMHAVFPSERPTTRELVGYQWLARGGAPTTHHLTYQFEFGDKWFAVNVSFQEPAPGRTVVLGMHVLPLPASLQETNRFTLRGKGLVHYMFLAASVGIPLFVIGTLVVCVRTLIPRRKWLWIVFILLGFVQFSLDWTSGQWVMQPIAFQLCGAGLVRSCAYAPWILSFSLPIGAVVFWLRRSQFQRAVSGPPLLPPS